MDNRPIQLKNDLKQNKKYTFAHDPIFLTSEYKIDDLKKLQLHVCIEAQTKVCW